MTNDGIGSGHAIVGGFGHLGNRIAAQLIARGKDVIVIELDHSAAMKERVESLGARLLVGDICNDAVLEEAGIRSACCFLAVTSDACANLEAAISAREMSERPSVVLRMFDQALASRIASGFDLHALSAASLASPAFVSAATDDSMVAAFTVDGIHLSLHRHEGCCEPDPPSDRRVMMLRDGPNLRTVSGDEASQADECLFAEVQGADPASRRRGHRSPSLIRRAGRALSQSSPRRAVRELRAAWRNAASITRSILVSLLAVGVLSVFLFSFVGGLSMLDALYFVVTTMTTVGYGDINLQNAPVGLKVYGVLMMMAGAGLLATVYALIADRVLTARVESLLGHGGVDLVDHTVVVGLGSVGYQVARDLHLLGIDVVGIEANSDRDNLGSARTMFPIVIGDASRPAILEKAGIGTASTVIALTDDTIVNLNVALQAREANPKIRTVLRTYQPDLAEKFRKLGLDEVLSTSAIAAPTFVDVALLSGAQGSFLCGDAEVLVVKHPVDCDSILLGKTVEDVGNELGIAVVLVAGSPTAEYTPATPDTLLSGGVKVIALLTRENVSIRTGSQPRCM